MKVKELARRLLIKGAYNYHLAPCRYFLHQLLQEEDKTRQQLFDSHAIDVVLDVGANYGQYAKRLQHAGFNGTIISFEPLQQAYLHLNENSIGIRNWLTKPVALGNANHKSVINIAGNSASSSLLDMHQQHLEAAPESAYKGTQEIEVVTLDSIFDTLVKDNSRVYLKIDTQGYEKQVLEGAAESIKHIEGLELEMSFDELYAGQTTFLALFELVQKLGFSICHFTPGLKNPATGHLLQADIIFFRK
jgi:FkbM family methyltransferase